MNNTSTTLAESSKKGIFSQRYLPIIIALAIFVIIAVLYCFPVIQGKVLQQSDVYNYQGAVQESKLHTQATGEHPWWTGSMFSGMPTYQIGNNRYASTPFIQPLSRITRLGFIGALGFLIGYLVCFYIMLRSFRVDKWLSIVGAIAIAFSSYFFIIVQAGHNTKALTIAMMAPVIAGFYLIFQKRYALGAIFTMIYSAIGFLLHPQMSYYMCLLIGLLFIGEAYRHCRARQFKELGINTLIFGIALLIGIGTGAGKYFVNQEYLKETMRGGHSELTKDNDIQNKTEGLNLDYATQWSYGIDETFTLLIPNYMGGSSHYSVGEKSDICETMVRKGISRRDAENFCNGLPTYWGKQPFTSGPVYVGAIVCLLFVLGLLIVEGPYKWTLLAATIFSVVLSWGKNCMGITRFFFDYFPMYNKFRAVSSILVVAEVAMPLLGFLALMTIAEGKIDKKALLKKIYIAAGITGGICLFFAAFGSSIYDFKSVGDAQFAKQLPDWLYTALLDQRASMLRTDALRSFLFIALATASLWLFVNKKLKYGWFVCVLGILIVIDMWPVNKRFFNDSDFVTKKQNESYFKELPYEKMILDHDKDPNFRVLNITSSTFNDARTSYRLKSIGGYSGAKLRRYQDLIDQHISRYNMEVLNMLNTKYFIVKGNNGPTAQLNPDAYGNAWFVDTVLIVNTPNEESDALNNLDLRHQAVTDAKFGKFVEYHPQDDPMANIQLTEYTPDRLTYRSNSVSDGIAIFSEIYYPYGWHAFIDNQPVEHFRADYTLRALNVPAGSHEISFEFHPDGLRKGNVVSMVCVVLMYGVIIASIAMYFVNKKKEKTLVKSCK